MSERVNEYRIVDEQADSITFEYNDRELSPVDIQDIPVENRPYDKLVEIAIANTIAEEYRTADRQIRIYKLASHSSAAVVMSGIIGISTAMDKANFQPASPSTVLVGGLIAVLSAQRHKVDNIRSRKQRLNDDIEDLLS